MSYDDEHGGYPLSSPFRRRHEADDPLGATNETPVDLAAVQADDALLDMLHAGEFDDLLERADALYDPNAVYVEMRVVLVRVLMAWRRDVDSEPIPVLIEAGEVRRSVLARIRAAVRGFFRLLGGNR